MSTAGTAMTRAAAHLNDASQAVYTAAVLLPYFNSALEELEEEMAVHDLSPLIKDAAEVSVESGDLLLDAMPVDFVEAISLRERSLGSTELWIEVGQVAVIDPNLTVQPVTSIIQWTIRNASIYINPPSSDRAAIIEYVRGLTTATGDGTALDVEVSRLFLALVTARNAASDAGNSLTKASSFEDRIARSRDRLIRRLQKADQSVRGVRRRPYTGRRG